MKTVNKTIDEFVAGFERDFNGVLRPVGSIGSPLPGRTRPFVTNHLVICVGETKFSDWDLHCYANTGRIALSDLNSMDKFVREFQRFECAESFSGNNMPQFMAFMPNESFAPFVDVHIECVTPVMAGQFFSGFDRDVLRDATNSWLLLTWWRKLKKGNQQDSDHFRDCWITSRFGSDRRIGESPTSFLAEYFRSRAKYASAANYLSGA